MASKTKKNSAKATAKTAKPEKKTPEPKASPVIGYKGFDSRLRCRDFQCEIGKWHETEMADLCHSGFHFCLNPMDVFSYYPPADGSLNRFAEVEAEGVSERTDDDSKKCATRLRIKAEIGLPGIIKAGVDFILSRVKKDDNPAATNTGEWSAATNTGEWSAATNTGNWSAATNTGYQSAATNTGYRSAAVVEGMEGVAASLGREGRAAGAVGCWLVLAEWEKRGDEWHRKDVRCVVVDGDQIRPGVFYTLKNGEFVEATE